MKLLFALILSGSLSFVSHTQKIVEYPSSLNDYSYKVCIRKSFQLSNPYLKFSPRALKSFEVCLLQSIQSETEIVIHVLDERHEVIVFPSNFNKRE